MSTFSIRVQPGPSNYWNHPHAIAHLDELYSSDQLSSAVWLHGIHSLQAALPYLPPSFHSNQHKLLVQGHCSHELLDQLTSRISHTPALAIGIGGGTILDITKALANRLQIPFVAIPTIAATCAAFTPLAVWYSSTGHAEGYEIFLRAAEAVLVDPRIILAAPCQYLKAGLADTLAKWYEASILCSQERSIPLTAQLGLANARILRDSLLQHGTSAFHALEKGEINSSFLDVIDAIIAGGGLVGGLGERYTRVAAAHAIHNGLSALPECAQYLHGLKVAYGILVQTALQDNLDELLALVSYYRTWKFPVCLADFGIEYRDTGKIDTFVSATLASHESIHLLPFAVGDSELRNAIAHVEAISNALRKE